MISLSDTYALIAMMLTAQRLDVIKVEDYTNLYGIHIPGLLEFIDESYEDEDVFKFVAREMWLLAEQYKQ